MMPTQSDTARRLAEIVEAAAHFDTAAVQRLLDELENAELRSFLDLLGYLQVEVGRRVSSARDFPF